MPRTDLGLFSRVAGLARDRRGAVNSCSPRAWIDAETQQSATECAKGGDMTMKPGGEVAIKIVANAGRAVISPWGSRTPAEPTDDSSPQNLSNRGAAVFFT